MKICLFTSTFPIREGKELSGRFVYDFATTLIEKGNNVLVVMPHAPGIPERDTIGNVKVIRFPYFYPKSMQRLALGTGMASNIQSSHLAKIQIVSYLICGLNKLYRTINYFRPDIVHALWAFPQGFLCALLKKFMDFPSVLSIFGGEEYLAMRYHLSKLIAFAANSADAVTVNSLATKIAAETCGADVSKFHIIFWGVDAERFNPKSDGSKVRELHKIGESPLIFTMGRMVERKGFRYLIEAMPKILEEFPNTKLILGSGGPLKQDLEKRVQKLELEDSVIFAGQIPSELLPNYYAACDVFCLPSIVDSKGETEGGQGLVTKEAMATGKPVVSTNVGGIPDLVIDGKTGILVEQKNPIALAGAIVKLLKDDVLRKKIAQNSYKLITSKVSWDAIVDKHLGIYQSIVSNR